MRFLLEHANRNFARPLRRDDVLGVRCGVRPLAVKGSLRRDVYPLSLSRRHAIDVDRGRAALTLYGGKFTSAAALAQKATRAIGALAKPTGAPRASASGPQAADRPINFCFAKQQPALIDPRWSRDHESCRTLLDYLRRRTDLAQKIPRLGLGKANEHEPTIRRIAAAIEGEARADAAVASLHACADRQDQLLDCAFMGA